MSAEYHPDDDADRWANFQQQISSEIHDILERRVVIEQTKGMLMFLYGVDADAAFEMLRVQSQQHNVKLHLIAEQILEDLVELSMDSPPAQRLDSDRVLLAAHQRVAHVAARQMDGQSKTG
jgi:ANTAR domain